MSEMKKGEKRKLFGINEIPHLATSAYVKDSNFDYDTIKLQSWVLLNAGAGTLQRANAYNRALGRKYVAANFSIPMPSEADTKKLLRGYREATPAEVAANSWFELIAAPIKNATASAAVAPAQSAVAAS